LSQSLAADNHASLTALDFAAAVVLHLFVFAFIAAVGMRPFWREFHPAAVEVRLISPEQLQRLQHPPAGKTVRAKPRVRAKPQPRPKARRKPKAHPQPRLHRRTRRRNFNPFKPLESRTDRLAAKGDTSVATQAPVVRELFEGQLSHQELNRYIALIQGAVQRHWKAPFIGGEVHLPLVEMVLNPDGSVRSVRILESSGNAALDASLIRAIKAAAPFPVPRRQFEVFRVNRIRFHPLR